MNVNTHADGSENLKTSNEGGVVNTLTKDDIEILLKNKGLSTDLRKKLLAMLGQENEELENKEEENNEDKIESLKGNKEKILDYLKTKCLEKKEGVTEYGIKGTHYCLTLPSVNGFDCKKIDWFVSYRKVTKKEYAKKDIRKTNSSTVQEISTNILQNMRDFLGSLGISEDVDMNFAEELFKINVYSCDTGNSVKKVTGLKDWYYLRNTNGHSHDSWQCRGSSCYFSDGIYSLNDYFAKLFLGLSVS